MFRAITSLMMLKVVVAMLVVSVLKMIGAGAEDDGADTDVSRIKGEKCTFH